ncbi:MAG: serine/threonine-protein kinase, partial [Chloroflexota bacterium]
MQIYAPGTRIGQYEIASNPMIGGMGVVYFCLDHNNNDRPVALKTFKPEYLPDRAARDRFLREGTAWIDLVRHPNIVRCYGVEYTDPNAFLSLELIAKEQGREDASLRSWMGAPMPVEQALLFALQIARGMKHATEKIPGFVHRDLKPENVLVGADKLPGTGINRLRVTDFGLVAILKDETGRLKDEENSDAIGRTHLTHGIVGTPLYMASEQWQGEALGIYTDVYALGCILYEMLTGQRAADGKTIKELLTAHCAGKLRPIPVECPFEVRELLTKSLALMPTQRLQSWDEFTCALEQAYIAQGVGSAPQIWVLAEESMGE